MILFLGTVSKLPNQQANVALIACPLTFFDFALAASRELELSVSEHRHRPHNNIMLPRRLLSMHRLLQPQRSLCSSASGCAWADLGLNPKVAAAARSLVGESSTPSEIQHLAVPRVLAGSHVACASETGSGKTLTFLLPLIEMLVLQRSPLLALQPLALAAACLC